MPLPASRPLELYRGDTYTFDVRLWSDEAKTIPIDLTDVDAAAQLRGNPGDALILQMECEIELPNIVHVTVAADSWPASVGPRANWDLEFTYGDGSIRTILAGAVIITDDVTVP